MVVLFLGNNTTTPPNNHSFATCQGTVPFNIYELRAVYMEGFLPGLEFQRGCWRIEKRRIIWITKAHRLIHTLCFLFKLLILLFSIRQQPFCYFCHKSNLLIIKGLPIQASFRVYWCILSGRVYYMTRSATTMVIL